METILQTTNLSRQFGKKMAVNNVNMTIHKGDIYGFIGKNGAGKTTFMRLVLGTAFPTKGEIQIIWRRAFDKARRKIGSLIEAPGLYKNCTAYENLKQFSLIYGGTDAEIKESFLWLVLLIPAIKNRQIFPWNAPASWYCHCAFRQSGVLSLR